MLCCIPYHAFSPKFTDHVAGAGDKPGEAEVAAETRGRAEVLARVEGIVGVAVKKEA